MTKNNKKTIIINTVFTVLIIAGILIISINIIKRNNNKKVSYLNDIIESNFNKHNKDTYLTIKSISQKFAINKKNAYYFASDGKYNYVVYLTEKKANELFKKDLENKPVKLYGISKNTSNKLKEIAIESYNTNNEDKKITISDYYSYFGDVYLDSVNVK